MVIMVAEMIVNHQPLTFEQGYICAVANLLRDFGDTTMARSLLEGMPNVDWTKIDPYDLDEIKRHGLLPNVKDKAPAERRMPASDCSTRCCEVCRESFELSEELQGELRELFESVKTCAKCCQRKLQEAYERTMVD